MRNYEHYKRGYYMPPVQSTDWVNKEYIDKQQWSRNDSATSAHDVFYEKVIEKVLHFTPDIVGVF